jgi:hypothetical protein
MTNRDDLLTRTADTSESDFDRARPAAAGAPTPEGREAYDKLCGTGGTLTLNGREVTPETGEVVGDDDAPDMRNGPRLVHGSGPHLPARMPHAERFRDSGGFLTDFCRAPDVEAIAGALIAHWEEVGHCRDLRIAYLWRRKKQAKAGKLTLGTCQKLSGLAKTFLEADWAITLNAENCRALQLTRLQLEALTYHELSHIGRPDEDEDGEEIEPTLVGHDVEMFHAEIHRYGLWKADLKAAAHAFKQLRLAL